MENFVDALDKKIELIKEQREEDLKDYTEKFRKLQKEYNELKDKKKNIKDFIDKSLIVEKELIDTLKKNASKDRSDTKGELQKAIALKNEAEIVLKNLQKDTDKFNKYKEAKNIKIKKEKADIAKKEQDLNNLKESQKQELNDLKLKERESLNKIAELKNLTGKNKSLLVKITAERKLNEIILEDVKKVNLDINIKDKELSSKIIKNNSLLEKISQKEDSLSKREEELNKKQSSLSSSLKELVLRRKEVLVSQQSVDKKLKEADVLYQNLKNKGAL